MNYFNESFDTEIKKYDKSGISFDDNKTKENNACSCMTTPVYECPRERVCHRYICHEVPHIMPCNTRIINHHVYRHTFRPEYTCCEENVCEEVFDKPCC